MTTERENEPTVEPEQEDLSGQDQKAPDQGQDRPADQPELTPDEEHRRTVQEIATENETKE